MCATPATGRAPRTVACCATVRWPASEHARRRHLQSEAMETRMRASEAAAAAQAQQARDIAARFSEQSAKNQHDSRRDHHFEQRLMLQVRPSPGVS